MRDYRKARWFVLTPVLVASSTAFVAAPPSRPIPACQVAANWVAANSGHLPTNLQEMDRLPMLYRRAVYRRVSAETRVRIWQEKLEPYLHSDRGLNETQRMLVAQVLSNLPQLVADPTGARGRQIFAEQHLEMKLIAAFGREQYRNMFIVLGTTAVADNPAAFPACDCYAEGPGFDCDIGTSCMKTGGCIPRVLACGPIGNDDCDGSCT